jgi:glutaminyl-peptide cyclotransferase
LVWYSGTLYESAGLYGQSSLRKVDPQTGKVLQRVDLPAQYFGEGLALAGNRLIQLTWHEQVAFIYDMRTFVRLGTLPYTGEGWGLCFDGRQFFQTDGSSEITVRDASTFQVAQKIAVTLDSQPVVDLNELECVDSYLYANVWHTDNLLRIDKETGQVTALINAGGLLTPEETATAGPEGVLNGLAFDPQTQAFWITGKLWPRMFEVRFVPLVGK